MKLRFSDTGPAFPFELIDDIIDGKVIFLCGAGISSPMLPGFLDLVTQCFNQLHVRYTQAEEISLKACRYEEVLGSLERRLVEQELLTKTIAQQLAVPANPNLSNHRTILRLSRDLNNRPCVVTTNFDTLLENAYFEESKSKIKTVAQSLAGQEIPRPGTTNFSGIIHLHGRLSDTELGLPQTPLIVTSAEYGDAYMRSGWASRFLFDLSRCKTIVLVGYRAGDAPVRYFLNVLEADRERFSDLQKVYALDSEPESNKSSPGWEALGVVPLTYQKELDPTSGEKYHTALWRDLAELADFIERPGIRRAELAKTLLSKPLDNIDKSERQIIRWLFNGRSDLNSIAIRSIADKTWFNFFHSEEIWCNQDAMHIIVAWIAIDLQSIERYHVAINWIEKFGKPFIDQIFQLVVNKNEMPDIWKHAWRIFSHLKQWYKPAYVNQIYAVSRRLNSDFVSYSDLQLAVELLSPKVKLRASVSSPHFQSQVQGPKSLQDIVWARLSIHHEGDIYELLDVLSAYDDANSLLNIATENFHESVRLAVDIGAIEEDYDRTSYDVPSVEFHAQNDSHEGLVLLAQLLTNIFPKAAKQNRDAAMISARSWKNAPGIVGTRLWVNAHRNTELFTADEAMECLLDISDKVFWNTDREVSLLIQERASEARDSTVRQLEHRILVGAENYFQSLEIEPGQVDWRPQLQDASVWLRLNMLEASNQLSDGGALELVQIKERQPYLDRPVEERDFFSTYSSGVQIVRGDAQPLIDAPESTRLEIAKATQQSYDIEKRHGWMAYCNLDLEGAFSTLQGAPLDDANVSLWESFVSALSTSDAAKGRIRAELSVKVFKALEHASDDFLIKFIHVLCNLYLFSPRRENRSLRKWWKRLFKLSTSNEIELTEAHDDFYFSAINSSSGQLAMTVLQDIEESQKADFAIPPRLVTALYACANGHGLEGIFARTVLINYSGFVLSLNLPKIAKRLSSALSLKNNEGKILRKILVSNKHFSERVANTFHQQILDGVTECDSTGVMAYNAAAKILTPGLSVLTRKSTEEAWGISFADAAFVLNNSMPNIHEAAARVLFDCASTSGETPEVTWHTVIRPLLEKIWPTEKVFRTKSTTLYLARLAINTGNEFPDAFSYIKAYLIPLETLDSYFFFRESNHPEKFPEEVLNLLWTILNGSSGDSLDIAQILDRLLTAAPGLEVDRRFQWLNRRALRFI